MQNESLIYISEHWADCFISLQSYKIIDCSVFTGALNLDLQGIKSDSNWESWKCEFVIVI